MFLGKRSYVFVLPLPFYNDNIKEIQRYIKQFRRLWLCRNYGLTESWRLHFALPRQQDNEYGGSRLVVSWSCSLRSIIRLPAPKIYLLYSLYHLYQSPSTHPILLNSVSSITLTAYTHYGLVLQRYEHPKSHFTLLSTFVPFCPLFVCKKLSYNRCFFRLRDYKTTRLRVAVDRCL